ncbi:MAG TPA: hypothetical protein VIS06_16775 [Mycobacteriales bacterium]
MVVAGADVAAGADVVTASVGVGDGVGVAVMLMVTGGTVSAGVDWLTRCIVSTPAVPDTTSTANAAPMTGMLFLNLIIFCAPRNAG